METSNIWVCFLLMLLFPLKCSSVTHSPGIFVCTVVSHPLHILLEPASEIRRDRERERVREREREREREKEREK